MPATENVCRRRRPKSFVSIRYNEGVSAWMRKLRNARTSSIRASSKTANIILAQLHFLEAADPKRDVYPTGKEKSRAEA